MAELEEYAATLCLVFNSTRNLGAYRGIQALLVQKIIALLCVEHLIGLSAGADGTQVEVTAVKTAAALDPDVMARLEDLGTVIALLAV